jgi:hypothetical protein
MNKLIEKASQASWVERGDGGLWGGAGRHSRAGPDPREDFKWKLIFQFQMNLRISIRRFRRNLDMRIFPKFF